MSGFSFREKMHQWKMISLIDQTAKLGDSAEWQRSEASY